MTIVNTVKNAAFRKAIADKRNWVSTDFEILAENRRGEGGI